MRRVLVALALALAALPCFAQYAADTTVASRSGIHMLLDGEQLTTEQRQLLLSYIDGADLNAEWNRYVRRCNVGVGLTIGGGVVVGAGVVTSVVGLAELVAGALVAPADKGKFANHAVDVLLVGLGGTAAGVVCLGVGIPFIVKSKHHLNGICDSYNSAEKRIEKRVILGSTPGGVGFTFNF